MQCSFAGDGVRYLRVRRVSRCSAESLLSSSSCRSGIAFPEQEHLTWPDCSDLQTFVWGIVPSVFSFSYTKTISQSLSGCALDDFILTKAMTSCQVVQNAEVYPWGKVFVRINQEKPLAERLKRNVVRKRFRPRKGLPMASTWLTHGWKGRSGARGRKTDSGGATGPCSRSPSVSGREWGQAACF